MNNSVVAWNLRRAIHVGLMPLLLCLSLRATAQTTYTERTEAKLRTSVHLQLGATTLAKVMNTLSEQTGLTIQAASYLQERKLIVRMNNLTASAALNALAELNNWTWRETDVGQILLTRPPFRTLQSIAEMQPAIQAALPKDWRRYLGIGVPPDELPPVTEEVRKAFERMQREMPDRSGEMEYRIGRKIDDLIQSRSLFLCDSLDKDPLANQGIPYSKLTEQQKEALRIVLVLSPMAKLNGAFTFRLMHGDLLPYQLDIAKAELFLTGDALHIGTTTISGNLSIFRGGSARVIFSPPTPKSK